MKTAKFIQTCTAIIFFLVYSNKALAQIGIGTTTPNSSAILDITNNTKGLLIPRMTEAQRLAITLPAIGLMVYQNDGIPGFYYNSGTPGLPNWVAILNSTSIVSVWTPNANDIYNLNIGNVGVGINTPIQKLDVAGNINMPLDSSYMINNIKILSTKGIQNTFVGEYAGRINTGTQNSGFGQASLYNNTSGSGNSAFGKLALQLNTTASNNSAFGIEALKSNTTGSANVAIGSYSLAANNANDNTAIGYAAQTQNVSGTANTSIGRETLFFNNSGSYNTAVGYRTLYFNSGNNNVGLGAYSLFQNTTGTSNTALGYQALNANNTGAYNTGTGWSALRLNTSGAFNCAYGISSLNANTTGGTNAAFGDNTLLSNFNGSDNTAIGSGAMLSNISGNYNTALGGGAGNSNVDGTYNTAIGYMAYANNSSATNTTAIGNAARVNADDNIVLGNTSVSEIGGYANWSNLSDGRFKKDVRDNVSGLTFILKLHPVTYHLDMHKLNKQIYGDKTTEYEKNMAKGIAKKEKIIYSGFIAQEVETAANSLGYNFSGVIPPQNEKDNYRIRYADFVVPLVKAVQELSTENNLLKEKLLVQENALETLKKKIEQIDNQLKSNSGLK